jgi:large subunit ribosomal protein L24
MRTKIKTIFKIRLKKGDTVIVRTGKYKGKTGKIVATHPSLNKVTVEGVNLAKKSVKPNKEYPQGTIMEITRPIWVSNVGIYDTATKKASKVGYKVAADGSKKRVMKSSGKEIA